MEEKILHLKSPLKDKAYGGHMIYDRFKLGDDPNRKVGEYWAISAHDNGLSIIKNGEFKGKNLKEVFETHKELFANSEEERFPLLVKINELNGAASVQVHPDDAYAKAYCNDLGKAEFCLYLDVDDNALLVRGHTAKTKDEFRKMANNEEWDKLIVRKPLKSEDFVYTPPGVLHGGEGHILMAEVQQSSDITYRVYDYDNVDAEGNPRETHLDKALEVMDVPHKEPRVAIKEKTLGNNKVILYIDNQYFKISRYFIKDNLKIQNEQYSICLVLSGSGSVKVSDKEDSIKMGDAFIVTSSSSDFEIKGKVEVLISEPPTRRK